MHRYPMVVSAEVRASVRVGFSAFGGGTDKRGGASAWELSAPDLG